MLYYKEPVFLLLGVFAAGRVLLKVRAQPGAGSRAPNFAVERALGGLIVLFLLLFLASQLRNLNLGYAERMGEPLGSAVQGYFAIDLLLFAFLCVVAARGILVVARRAAPDALWDPVAADRCVRAEPVALGQRQTYHGGRPGGAHVLVRPSCAWFAWHWRRPPGDHGGGGGGSVGEPNDAAPGRAQWDDPVVRPAGFLLVQTRTSVDTVDLFPYGQSYLLMELPLPALPGLYVERADDGPDIGPAAVVRLHAPLPLPTGGVAAVPGATTAGPGAVHWWWHCLTTR